MTAPLYVCLPAGHSPPTLGGAHFRCLVIVNQDVEAHWQEAVSSWLVTAGCRYMMAWGRHCSSWHDSVDWTAQDSGLNEHEDDFVMTTWHADETLGEAMWYCIHCAFHPTLELTTILLDISQVCRKKEILTLFEQVRAEA